MLFCERCGGMVIPKTVRGKNKLSCSACGYSSKKRESLVLKEKTELKGKKVIDVVDKKIEMLPKTKEDCPKCGYKEAFYWLVQTRAADEAETRFFKCVKCNHTWRAYH